MMRKLHEIRAATPKSEIFRGQLQYLMITILLVVGTDALLRDSGGTFLGIGTVGWAYVTIAIGLILLAV